MSRLEADGEIQTGVREMNVPWRLLFRAAPGAYMGADEEPTGMDFVCARRARRDGEARAMTRRNGLETGV